ncbi:transcriptional regulator, partial [Halobacteriales archaeon QS_9_68_42]
MAQTTERLRRYLDEELEECRSEDVERRLDELETLGTVLGTEQVASELDVLSALANR